MKAANYVGGHWQQSKSSSTMDVVNPATSEILATVHLSTTEDVNAVIAAASAAFPAWRRTPPQDRIQYLFRFASFFGQHADEIARLTTLENGKTFAEARAELQRGIENVEVACGIPTLMQGYNLEDVAERHRRDHDPPAHWASRRPSRPFNFPAMIPLWFLPYAIACGNTFILKPSERVPLTCGKLFELLARDRIARGRAEPRDRRQAGGRCPAPPPRGPRHQLRRFHARRALHLRGRLGQRQARAVPGRRQEPRGRHARCRSRHDRQDRQRQRLRLRRPALPGRFRRHHGRRCGQEFPRRHRSISASGLQGRQRPRRGRADGPRHHPAEQGHAFAELSTRA